MDEVGTLLQKLNFGEFAAAFKQQNIDGKQLEFLETPADIQECSISMPRIKASALITDMADFKVAGGVPMDLVSSTLPPPPPPPPPVDAEKVTISSMDKLTPPVESLKVLYDYSYF